MTWQRSTLKGYPPEPRKHHSMVSVGSQLYVFGGVDSAGRICENLLYVIDTGTYTSFNFLFIYFIYFAVMRMRYASYHVLKTIA